MSQLKCNRRRFVGTSAGLIASTTSWLPAPASGMTVWPDRPIRLIVPFAPAGGGDVIARAVASKLSVRLGQPVVTENKGGAGGTLGVDAVAKAAPDGYTLLMTTTAISTNAASGRKLPFDLARDLSPIGQIGATPLLILVAADSPIKTLAELVALARSRPGGLSYGSSGVGSMSHIGMELFATQAKMQLLHVPYKGVSMAFTDLIAGNLQAALASFATASPLIDGGKLRALAITSAQRSTFAPILPTVAESGYPGFQIDFWWGLMGPARMPAQVIKRLNTELNAVLAQPDMAELLSREAAVTVAGTPEDFGRLMALEHTRWSRLIKDADIRID